MFHYALRWLGILCLFFILSIFLIKSLSAAFASPKVAFVDTSNLTVRDLRTGGSYQAPVISASFLSWSSNGRYLYLTDRTNAESDLDIYVHDSFTGQTRILFTAPMEQYVMSIAPNGRWLIYLSVISGQPSLFYLYDLQAQANHNMFFSLGNIIALNNLTLSFVWSEDSRYLAFIEHEDVYRYDTETGDFVAIIKGEPIANPRWLNAGTALAYTTLEGNHYAIQRYDLSSNEVSTLLDNLNLPTVFLFNPTESGFIFTETESEGGLARSQIRYLDLATGNRHDLVSNAHFNQALKWLNQTTFLYTQSSSTGQDLFRFDIATGQNDLLFQSTKNFALWWAAD